MGEAPKQSMFFIRDPETAEVKGPLTVQQLRQWYSRGVFQVWGVSKSPKGPWILASHVKGLTVATPRSCPLPPGRANTFDSHLGGSEDVAESPSKVVRGEKHSAAREADLDSMGRLVYDVFFAIRAKMLEPSQYRESRRREPAEVSSKRSSIPENVSAPAWAWFFAIGLLVSGFLYMRSEVADWSESHLRETTLAVNRREQLDADRREQREQVTVVNREGRTDEGEGRSKQSAQATPSDWLVKSGRTKSDAVEFVFFPRQGELSASISLVNNSHTPIWATVSITSTALGSSFVDGLLYDVKPGRRETATVTWKGPVPKELWARSIFDIAIEDLDAKVSQDWSGMDLTGVLRPVLYVRAEDLPRVRSSDFDVRVLR
jgi:hypothetical protein